jgi:hypothetical protein
MTDTYYLNIETGDRNEEIYKPILEKTYGKLNKLKGKYSKFDYKGKNLYIELKARKKQLDYYPDAMIGYNKITAGFEYIKQGKKVFFCFAYPTGLYSVEFTQEFYDLNGGDSKIKQKEYYIENRFLTQIDETPVWIHPFFLREGVCYIKL